MSFTQANRDNYLDYLNERLSKDCNISNGYIELVKSSNSHTDIDRLCNLFNISLEYKLYLSNKFKEYPEFLYRLDECVNLKEMRAIDLEFGK